MKLEHGRQKLLTVFGVSAGVATGVAAGIWLWRKRGGARPEPAPWAEPRGSAQEVYDSLRSDPRLSKRRIEVDAIAEGVVELSGSVRDRDEADQAVGIAQRTTGVYTVVNRLRIEAEEAQREATRRRWNEGAPELRERKHYGMGVGMGATRHAPETDPDRPSDKQRMIERELEVGAGDEAPDAEELGGAEASAAEESGGAGAPLEEPGMDAEEAEGDIVEKDRG